MHQRRRHRRACGASVMSFTPPGSPLFQTRRAVRAAAPGLTTVLGTPACSVTSKKPSSTCARARAAHGQQHCPIGYMCV